MVSRSTSFGPSACTADTYSAIGSAYTFANTGTIRQIRVTGYNGVTDKADSAILKLTFKRLSGPFEFTVYPAGHEVTVGGRIPTDKVDVDIPYSNGEQVTVEVKASEALEDVIVSLTMVE